MQLFCTFMGELILSPSSGTVPFVGNSVTIKFHSGADISIGGRGYRIRVGQSTSSVIPSVCGGVVTTPTATLQSPNYPSSYPPNSNCRYVVNKVSRDICQLQLKVKSNEGVGFSCYIKESQLFATSSTKYLVGSSSETNFCSGVGVQTL